MGLKPPPVPDTGGPTCVGGRSPWRPRCIGISAASRRVVERPRSWPGHLAAAVYIKYRNIKGDPLWAFAAISGPGRG